jgi:hypothetical protein
MAYMWAHISLVTARPFETFYGMATRLFIRTQGQKCNSCLCSVTCAVLQWNVIVVGSILLGIIWREEGTHRIRANTSNSICSEFKNGAEFIFSVAQPTEIFLHTLGFIATMAFLKYPVHWTSTCPYSQILSQEQATSTKCMEKTSVCGPRCLLVFDVPITWLAAIRNHSSDKRFRTLQAASSGSTSQGMWRARNRFIVADVICVRCSLLRRVSWRWQPSRDNVTGSVTGSEPTHTVSLHKLCKIPPTHIYSIILHKFLSQTAPSKLAGYYFRVHSILFGILRKELPKIVFI